MLITIYWLGRQAQCGRLYDGPNLNFKAFEGLLGTALYKVKLSVCFIILSCNQNDLYHRQHQLSFSRGKTTKKCHEWNPALQPLPKHMSISSLVCRLCEESPKGVRFLGTKTQTMLSHKWPNLLTHVHVSLGHGSLFARGNGCFCLPSSHLYGPGFGTFVTYGFVTVFSFTIIRESCIIAVGSFTRSNSNPWSAAGFQGGSSFVGLYRPGGFSGLLVWK